MSDKLTAGQKLLAGCFGGILGVFVIVPLIAYELSAMGFVLMKIWNWFTPSLGVGVPAIGFVQGVGLRLLWRAVSGLKMPGNTPDIPADKVIRHAVSTCTAFVVGPWFLLLIAYLISLGI